QPKSILAIPLIYQSHLSGVLYLENNLTPAAFTPLHLEMLELLSSQMAISIGHAKLYSELSESEQRFRVIAETSPIPLIISRPDDGAILYVNAQIHSIYGLSPKQLIGHYHTTDFYAHPAERQKLLVQIQQHGYVHHYEVQFKKIDQTPIWVDLFIRPIMFKNEPALLTAVYDMTDRKRVEEERIRFIQEREAKNAVLQLNEEIQAQKEELACALAQLQAAQQQLVESEKMSSLCHLVAGVAHEINTPIGISVTGISQMESLTQNLAHLFEHKQLKRSDLQKYLDNANQINSLIFKNLTRAAELISSFKQVAVDQSSEQQRQFNLNAYLHEIINSLKPELKQLRPQILIDCDQNINLYSYPGVFCQIITNLVMNSLIHGVNQQKNAIINLRVHQQLQAIKIIYSDNGQGMPPATLKKIFEPFFTTNRHGGGSGLGLHIVYNLVTHKLNGTIHCTSSVGQGTTFTLTLPFTE
ncbi:MAG: ATP-binding protein, partial [Pseudomonadota bacterium]|nr:ATP-binding protein [Pseudomonadota bacterium]